MSQPLLKSGEQEYVAAQLSDQALVDRIEALECRFDELDTYISTIPNIKRDAVVTVLALLIEAVRHVASGKMDIPDVTQIAGSAPDIRLKAAWENWKSKLPGLPARFIDALLLHGPMTQTQLRIAVGCAAGSVASIVSTLWKAGLIDKNSGRISLKQL